MTKLKTPGYPDLLRNIEIQDNIYPLESEPQLPLGPTPKLKDEQKKGNQTTQELSMMQSNFYVTIIFYLNR